MEEYGGCAIAVDYTRAAANIDFIATARTNTRAIAKNLARYILKNIAQKNSQTSQNTSENNVNPSNQNSPATGASSHKPGMVEQQNSQNNDKYTPQYLAEFNKTRPGQNFQNDDKYTPQYLSEFNYNKPGQNSQHGTQNFNRPSYWRSNNSYSVTNNADIEDIIFDLGSDGKTPISNAKQRGHSTSDLFLHGFSWGAHICGAAGYLAGRNGFLPAVLKGNYTNIKYK